MIFGPTPLDQAEGAYLAHAVVTGRGRLAKGHHLNEADIGALKEAGLESVIAARLEEGDLHEDAAAARLGAALQTAGITIKEAFTGRCNLHSDVHGLLGADEALINAFNGCDEGVTLATLPPYSVVQPGQMIATVKIIPLAVPGAAVERAAEFAAHAPLRIHPFRPQRAGLILTRLPQTKASVLEKTADVVAQRLAACDSELSETLITEHDAPAVARAISDLAARGCAPILIFGASAITDRGDVLPAAVQKAGGAVEHLGMPVDPGNLLMLGSLAGTPVIGLPGCARSPKLNGFDWVLQRLLAGLEVRGEDLTAMGCGGLLQEIVSRPQPREEAPRREGRQAESRAPKVAALLLAGGQSRRMGKANKLLQPWKGRPLIGWVAKALAHSRVEETIVVTGHEAGAVRTALEGQEVTFVHNPLYAEGLSTSLKAGLATVPADCDAVLVCLGDMPQITTRQIDTLIAAFAPRDGAGICLPTYRGKRGNPVLWDRRFIPEMMTLHGDSGARQLMGVYESELCEVPVEDAAVLLDIDTPDALNALHGEETPPQNKQARSGQTAQENTMPEGTDDAG